MFNLRAEIINPFLNSSRDIFSQVGNVQMEQKDAYVRKEIQLKDNLGIVIGITGDLKGQVIINLPIKIGKKIASNMMGGMPIATLDNIAKSAISEMGNMIMGNSATNLYNLGIKVDITPPSIILGKEMNYSVVDQTILCIPYETSEDVIEINISLKE